MIPSSINGNIDVPASVDAQGNVHIGHQIVHNYYVSTDWQKLQQRLTDALENYQSFPEHPKFAQQLQTVQDEIESFKRDVVKLAQDFQKIPLNTERLKQAKAYFDQGDYEKARGVLDTEALGQEQEVLLAEKDVLETKLAANADEFMLLAQLTALNFDLGEERISKACEAFESALRSQRTAKYLNEYASFLNTEKIYNLAAVIYRELINLLNLPDDLERQETFKCPACVVLVVSDFATLLSRYLEHKTEAERLFQSALQLARRLADENHPKGKSYLAIVLNGLAFLIYEDISRQAEAEALYREALKIRRYLFNEEKTLINEWQISQTLHNFGILLSENKDQLKEAEELYLEALKIRRQAASESPQKYECDVANTANSLACLLADIPERLSEAESLYHEALIINKRLANKQPDAHEPAVADVLYNLAQLKININELRKAEDFCQEAVQIRRRLAIQYPAVYEPELADALSRLGVLVSHEPDRHNEATQYFQEALQIRRQAARLQPTVYQPYMAVSLKRLANHLIAVPPQRSLVQNYYEEALAIFRNLATQHPTVYQTSLAQTLHNLSFLLLNTPTQLELAKTYAQEAFDLYCQLAQQSPNIYKAEAKNTFNVLARIYRQSYFSWLHPIRTFRAWKELLTYASRYLELPDA